MSANTQPQAPATAELLDLKPIASISLWQDVLRRLMANRLSIISLTILAVAIFLAIFGPQIAPHDYLTQNLSARREAPSQAYWLGTDELGRDVFSRVIHGTRTALIVAISVTTLSLLLGVLLGSLAGYLGGQVDATIMWFTDLTMSIPSLLLAIVINTSLKPPISRWMEQMYLETRLAVFHDTTIIDFVLVFGALSLVLWPPYARLIRGQILSVRKKNYVLAAEALGLPTWRILLRYVIPNTLGPVIVAVSAGLGTAMVLESAFSFLGIGIRPPQPSWGNMITEGLRIWRGSPHLLIAPACALGLVTIAFSLLGDALNDALNPRQWK